MMFVLAAQSLKAEELLSEFFTNSTLFTVLVALGIIAFVQIALRNVTLVPSGLQNFAEWMVESLYTVLQGVVGNHLIKKTFPLLGTLFFFILIANWSALVPGIGTVGFGGMEDGHFHIDRPLLRPSNADLNTPAAAAVAFMIVWLILSIKEVGFGGFFGHLFLPKGGVSGVMWWVLLPLFIMVGAIEVVSILFRPVSLSLRLFGNIFAGENLLWGMGAVAGPIFSVIVSLPFYCMELLIGVIQALVFTLLCSVYIVLSASHDEGH